MNAHEKEMGLHGYVLKLLGCISLPSEMGESTRA